MTDSPITKATQLFIQQGGIIRSSNAIALGIHPRTLYQMRDSGIIEQLSRGVFRLAELSPLQQPDIVTVTIRSPNSILCLTSALAFHNMGTQIPRKVHIACHQGSEKLRIDYPPTQVFWFSRDCMTSGVENHLIDGVEVKIFSPAKTVADCFKFRNKIGIDVAIEALKSYWYDKKGCINELVSYASICRVENIIKPYMQPVLHG